MKLSDKVFRLIEPLVVELGYELYDVEFAKEYDNWVLTIYIDSPGGISLDDCERVSTALDPVLYEADPIEQAYYLSVSSVGIDRPLKKDKDFARNIGKTLDIKLYAPMNGKKEFCAQLVSFDESSFTVIINGKSVVIARKAAAMLRPHIDF